MRETEIRQIKRKARKVASHAAELDKYYQLDNEDGVDVDMDIISSSSQEEMQLEMIDLVTYINEIIDESDHFEFRDGTTIELPSTSPDRDGDTYWKERDIPDGEDDVVHIKSRVDRREQSDADDFTSHKVLFTDDVEVDVAEGAAWNDDPEFVLHKAREVRVIEGHAGSA